jgi:hypothetical protein
MALPGNTMKVEVARISAVELPIVWRTVEPLVSKALAHTEGEVTSADLRDAILLGQMQLWLVTNSHDILAVATTEVIDYAQFASLRVVTLAGCGLEEWGGLLYKELEKFGLAQGVKRIEAVGRKGLIKALAGLGFAPVYTVVTRQIGVRNE